jgi:hypothetical protein
MRALPNRIWAILAFGSSLACGASTQSVTDPSTVKCLVTATAEPATFPAGGGTGTLTVSASRDCEWTAAASGSWIQLGARASGQGDASVAFTVGGNPDPAGRRGAITIGDQQVAISQDAAACTFAVSPVSDSVSPDGERRTIAVTANAAQCSWAARSEADWLSVVQGSQGTGNGHVIYEARATTGPPRSGALTIAGHRVTVRQGDGCTVAIAPASVTMSASGGSASVSVTTAANCSWSARSEATWIAITGGAPGRGPGSVSFSVAQSEGPQRSATVTVGEQAFTVTQASGCRFGVNPESYSIGSAGGSSTVAVTATSSACAWSAASNASWITLGGRTSSNGNGTVPFTVAATTGPARSGTLTIAGRTFAVNQGSGCSYSITPTSDTIPSGGGSGTVTVNTTAGCAWAATSSVQWVSITTGQSGTGPGSVTFAVDDTRSSLPRSTTLGIAGQRFTITQRGAPCSYVLNPSSAQLDAGGGSGSFELNTPEACSWTATSNDGWLHVTAGQTGSGDGTVRFAADPNPGSARMGTITAAGRSFTVSQAGSNGAIGSPD